MDSFQGIYLQIKDRASYALTQTGRILNTFRNSFLQPHHEFEHNYEYLYTSSSLPTGQRDERLYSEYQSITAKHIRRNLIGSESEHIINDFHHPVATIDDIYNAFIEKGDLPDYEPKKDEHYWKALESTTERFRPPFLIRPVHYADLRLYKWNWHPNVEEPYRSDPKLQTAVADAYSAGLFENGRMSFGNLKNVVFNDARHFLHRIKRNEISNPLKLYPLVNIHVKPALTEITRTKIRIVKGVSKRHILPSAQFYWPLFNQYLKNRDWSPLLWGCETILGGGMILYQEALIPRLFYQTFIMIDWSGYDWRVILSMLRQDHRPAMRSYFDFDNGYIPTKFYPDSPVDPTRLETLWDWVCEAEHLMPHRMPDGHVYRRKYRNFDSGLFNTQFSDSFDNMHKLLTILSAMGFDISRIRIRVQGDDSVIYLVFYIPADQHDLFRSEFDRHAKEYFDAHAKPENVQITNSADEIEALGYTYPNGYPTRDRIKLLAQLHHPRARSPTKELLMARCCGIQYASMYRYPDVTNILKDIYFELKSQGIKPSVLPLQRDVILHSEENFAIPTDHFPTMNEVTAHLRVPYVRTDKDNESYFPSSHFLSDH